jgi:urease accessory protein
MTRLHQDGLLALRFATDRAGRTYLAGHRQRFPLRTTVPLYLDEADPGMAFVYVQNPTGGVFAGDHLTEDIIGEVGAHVHMTTQSATKLYRMEGGAAVQELSFRLQPEAYVEHMPDPFIPQAGSRFEQRLTVEMAERAAFVAGETVAPGRLASGERFAYDRLLLRTEVRGGDRELFVDTLLLEPARRTPSCRGLLGRYDYVASLLAVAPGRDAEALAAHLDGDLARLPDVLAAAGTLPCGAGAFARILAHSAVTAQRALAAAWRVARRELLGCPLPPRRK